MRNIFYRYNPQTLSFERVFPSWKKRVASVFRQLFIGVLIGVCLFAFAMYTFDSPREQQLKKNNKLLTAQYEILSRRQNETQKVLEDLRQRDDQLYRAIFQADPIPESIRKPGFGGTNRYEHLMEMPNSDLVIFVTQKMDMISKQLYVQSNSFDEIATMIKTQEDRLKCVPAIQPVANKDLKKMASGYGMRIDPIYRTPRFHSGMDFSAKIGTEIYATGDGVVEKAERYSEYGNCVIINHGYGYKTLYGHCDRLKVRSGQKVSRGEVIALVGNTGKSTGPHLHYEVIVKGQHDNPAKYYFMDLTPEEYTRMIEMAENHGQVMD
ncbi:MAG: M23 family metallopeptidase [Dysgonamonadaceae bacterium]|jgi:murein DD-endopeptidase MepM/ murein hydrolase activator NlpD|nr:M23 family metallopeptidase [Dysgonamonadaceae bacterium]